MAISRITRQAIIEAYKGRCQYCSCDNADQVDHILAQSIGGTDELENLTLACQSCNSKKSNLSLPKPFAGILMANALSKKGAIEKKIDRLRKRRNSSKPIAPSTQAPWRVYCVEHYKFDSVHAFWTVDRLRVLFQRCRFALNELNYRRDTLCILMTGSVSGLYKLGFDKSAPFVDIRDLLVGHDFHAKDDYFFIGLGAYRWKERSKREVRTVGCNFVSGMVGRGETAVLKIRTRELLALLSAYEPDMLADAAFNKLYFPYLSNDQADEELRRSESSELSPLDGFYRKEANF